MIRSGFVAALGLTWAAAASAACAPDRIELLGPKGPIVLSVEIADDPEEQAKGLMFRPSLAADHGMLFVFDDVRPAGFWMKNTMIPLDMLFIDDAGIVRNIAARTEPYSERLIASDGPVRAVLEIAGGQAAAYGIVPGSGVRHPAFTQARGAQACAG